MANILNVNLNNIFVLIQKIMQILKRIMYFLTILNIFIQTENNQY
jgi:hypothetical protein